MPDVTSGLPLWIRPLVSGVGAFLLTAALTPLVIRLARRRDWVAEPREDRWHEQPTALMGGLAIYAGVTVGWIAAPGLGVPWGLWAGGSLLFLSGLADDLDGLSPVAKVVVQVAGATVVLLAGWELAPAWPVWLSVPLTYLWVIGITNAVNLLDNMDGLAAGITGIAALTVAGLSGIAGSWSAAGPALVLAGACAGFLVYNFQPARIFMGDSGALFLGFSVSTLAISQPGAGASGTAAVLAVPASVMAVPILDTTLVTVKRIVARRPVTQGGKDHSSHRLVFLGLSERRAVLTLYGVAVLFSALAVALRLFDVMLTLGVAALAAVALAVLGVFLAQVRVAETGDADRASEPGPPKPTTDGRRAVADDAERREGERGVALRAVLRHKREMAILVADLLLVTGSFVVAHYLRFEGGPPNGHLERMVTVLPAVVLVKIAALWAVGAYRGILRYAGTHELVKIAKGSTLASGLIVVGVALAFRFQGFSRSVFVIDWMLATGALGALRGGLRALRSYFAERRQRGGERILLYGAGDAGYLALREIQQNPELNLEPVGFVDDDPDKQGHTVHGLPVLGGGGELGDLCRDRDVGGLIVTISSPPGALRRRAQRTCAELGVAYREMRVTFAKTARGEDGTRGTEPASRRREDERVLDTAEAEER